MFKNKILTEGIFLVGVVFIGAFSTVYVEEIDSYQIDIIINKDISVQIKEKVDYNFKHNRHHGIYRIIPTEYLITGKNR